MEAPPSNTHTRNAFCGLFCEAVARRKPGDWARSRAPPLGLGLRRLLKGSSPPPGSPPAGSSGGARGWSLAVGGGSCICSVGPVNPALVCKVPKQREAEVSQATGLRRVVAERPAAPSSATTLPHLQRSLGVPPAWGREGRACGAQREVPSRATPRTTRRATQAVAGAGSWLSAASGRGPPALLPPDTRFPCGKGDRGGRQKARQL